MRLDQLTFTRFLAAIAIVVFHYGQAVYPFNSDVLSYLFGQANMGVSYFFMLSGFVMMIAYGKKEQVSFSNYLRKRLARIYPAYLLAIIMTLTYCLYSNEEIDYVGLFFNIFLIQSWIPGYALSFNTPGWSLSVEMFFYVSFPFLFKQFYKRYSLKTVSLIVISIFILSQVALFVLKNTSFYIGSPSPSHDLTFYFPLMHLNEFLMGNIAGLFFIKGIRERNYDLWLVALIIALVLVLKLPLVSLNHNGLLAFIFIPFILLLSANKGVFTRLFMMKSFVFLGEISYGIYILQKPVFDFIIYGMKRFNIDNPNTIFYTGVAILLLCSALSYWYVETPLRRMITKKS